jgi:hypothetical protein
MARVTLARINAALAAAGHAERLVRGAGYFYFAEGTASAWPSSGVYGVGPNLSALTVEQWVAEHATLRAACEAWR